MAEGRATLACNLCGSERTARLMAARDAGGRRVDLYGCPDCGSVTPGYSNRLGARTEVEAQTEYHADMWSSDNAEQLDLLSSQAEQLANEILAQVAAPRGGGLVCDLGAGRGNIAHALRRVGFKVIACEPSQELAAIAWNSFRFTREQFRSVDIDTFLSQLADEKQNIQVGVLWHVLEHLEDAGRALDLLRDRLEPHSWVFIELPLPVSRHIFPMHRWLATPATGKWLADRLGLALASIQIIPGDGYVRFVLSGMDNIFDRAVSPEVEALVSSDWSAPSCMIGLYDLLFEGLHVQQTTMRNVPTTSAPRRKRLVLHIGYHRTGSSALQAFLFENRVALRQHGVVYPQPLAPRISHLEIARSVFPDRITWLTEDYVFEDVLAHHRRVIDDAPAGSTIVLSCEELTYFESAPERMAQLRAAFAGIETKVVAYIRRPADFLGSLYNYAVLHGALLSFSDFIVDQVPPDSAKFSRRLAPWRQTFGEGHVIVRDYDDLQEDLASDFLTAIGKSEASSLGRTRHGNGGIHPWLLDAFFEVTRSDVSDEQKWAMRDALLQAGSRLPRIDAALHYLGPERHAELKSRFGSDDAIAP